MRRNQFFDHLVLLFGVVLMMGPVVVAFMTSTHDSVYVYKKGLQFTFGGEFANVYGDVLTKSRSFSGEVTALTMLKNSLILGLSFAIGKIVLSMLAAYGIVYFRFKLGVVFFWMIFTTLLLPLEVRIIPSYEIANTLGILNSYQGLVIPLLASATGTFFFRQFYLSVPDELLEAARIDGAGPWKFFIDIIVPLSRTMAAALFIIMFVYGWNQYLWPTLIATDESYFTIVRGVKQILQVWVGAQLPDISSGMALAIMAILPPVLVVIFFQRWFVKGLTESDK